MDTLPFILMSGRADTPTPPVDHCACGIHRADCTYHATPAPTPIPSNPRPLYTIRIKGQHYAHIFIRTYTGTLDKVRSLEMAVILLAARNMYTNVTISITKCDK